MKHWLIVENMEKIGLKPKKVADHLHYEIWEIQLSNDLRVTWKKNQKGDTYSVFLIDQHQQQLKRWIEHKPYLDYLSALIYC